MIEFLYKYFFDSTFLYNLQKILQKLPYLLNKKYIQCFFNNNIMINDMCVFLLLVYFYLFNFF